MKIILYCHQLHTGSKAFIEALHKIVPQDNIFYAFSTQEIQKIKGGIEEGKTIDVLIAENESDLRELLKNRKYFQKYETFLILPNSRNDTIELGRLLHPKFLTWFGRDPSEMIVMINRAKNNVYSK